MVTSGLKIYKVKLSKADFFKDNFFCLCSYWGHKPDKLEFYYFNPKYQIFINITISNILEYIKNIW